MPLKLYKPYIPTNQKGLRNFVNESRRLAKESENESAFENALKYVNNTKDEIFLTGSPSYTSSSYQAKEYVRVPTMSDLRWAVRLYTEKNPYVDMTKLREEIINLYRTLKPANSAKGSAGGRRKSHRKHKKHARRTRRHR
jgi:hypothetical protein